MRQVNRTRPFQVVRAGWCLWFSRIAILLCLVSGVVGFHFLCESNLKVTAARRPVDAQVSPITLGSAFRGGPGQSNRSESDRIWRAGETSAIKSNSAASGG